MLSQIPGISPVVRAASIFVGQKFLMAITGLLLCRFLVTHVAGNRMLYTGAEQFKHYAELLHSRGLLLNTAEVGLACCTKAMNHQN